MRRRLYAAVLGALLAAGGSAPAAAQPLFYQVYGWETLPAGWVEPALWTTAIVNSDLSEQHFGKTLPRDGLMAHELELAYGMTDRLTLEAYADFTDPDGGSLEYSRFRFAGRYRLFGRYQRFFDTALYAEYTVPRQAYSNTEELETRIILQKDMGDFRLRLNPIFSKAMSGDQVDEGVEAGFAGGLYWRRHYRWQPGIEYYANYGPLQNPTTTDSQPQMLFGTLDLHWGGSWRWHLGVGTGLTDGSDDLIATSIISYEFGTVRPSKQAQ